MARSSTHWKQAPPGHLPCFICHRYLDPAKLDDRGKCLNQLWCQKAAASMPNRPSAPPKGLRS